MSSPTRGAKETIGSGWTEHRFASLFVRAVVLVAPLVASLATATLVSKLLNQGPGLVGAIAFIVPVMICALATAAVVERAMRRLLPLANLLSMSLVFPDQVPSRFSVALRTGTARQLQRSIDDVTENGFSSDETEAALQLLDMMQAISRHEPTTRGHTERVRAYADLIAAEMGLSQAEREKLHWAAMVHDIGKLHVPADILNKQGSPTEEEWEILASHPVHGGEMVEPLVGWLGEWRLAAGEHHEKWDGSGYPKGLQGKEISLAGRIVAVADAYDVITATRSYKKPMSAEAARQELVRCSGTQFDPAVTRAMLNASIGDLQSRWRHVGWLVHMPQIIRPVAQVAIASVVPAAVAVSSFAVAAPNTDSTDIAQQRIEQIAATSNSPDETSHDERDDDRSTGSLPANSNHSSDSLNAPTGTESESSSATTPSTSVGTSSASGPTTPSTKTRPTTPSTAEQPSSNTSASQPTQSTPTSAKPPAQSTPTPAQQPTQSPAHSTQSSPSSPASSPASPPTTTGQTTTTTTVVVTPPAGADCGAAQSGETNLAGADLTHCNLSGVNLSGANLATASLSGANLTGAVLVGANMAQVDLTNANLTNASITTTLLANARLDGAVFNGAEFDRSRLTGATGNPSSATGSSWSETYCPNGAIGWCFS